MIKEGYDHFEVTHLEPRVGICEKRYIFENESADSPGPAERCPAYSVPEDVATSVREKQRRDDIETVELINRGIPSAPVTTGVDGGINPTFLAKAR
jgi:murein L,D-transpeptidase YafK